MSLLCLLCLQSSKMAASKKTQKSLSSFFSSPTTRKYKMSASSEPSESVHPVCDSTISTEAVLKSECDPWLLTQFFPCCTFAIRSFSKVSATPEYITVTKANLELEW